MLSCQSWRKLLPSTIRDQDRLFQKGHPPSLVVVSDVHYVYGMTIDKYFMWATGRAIISTMKSTTRSDLTRHSSGTGHMNDNIPFFAMICDGVRPSATNSDNEYMENQSSHQLPRFSKCEMARSVQWHHLTFWHVLILNEFFQVHSGYRAVGFTKGSFWCHDIDS